MGPIKSSAALRFGERLQNNSTIYWISKIYFLIYFLENDLESKGYDSAIFRIFSIAASNSEELRIGALALLNVLIYDVSLDLPEYG